MRIPFLKMHGAGNDFVVIDCRKASLPALDWGRIAHRNFGIGCDQIVLLENSPKADVFMRIINADSSESSACGNATRCVAWLVANERKTTSVTIETKAGLLGAQVNSQSEITIDMGAPRTEWQDIPLANACDTLHLPIREGVLEDPVAVNMGNPHMVFFVAQDPASLPLAELGSKLEHHALFPERTNVEAAKILAPDEISLRVWERGSGLTLACGTGACATLVAARRRGLTASAANVHLPGGTLHIEWRESDNRVLMTGAAQTSFEGAFNSEDYQP